MMIDEQRSERLKLRLDLWQLEIFCAVAEHQSFSRAGEALFISQPTVTTHIAALEKRLGVKLFDRTTRRVTLTPAGKLLYRRAKALLAEHEAALQELSRFQGGLIGSVVFGASTIPGQYLLPGVMAQFCQGFPEVRLTMRIGDSQQILDSVAMGELEFGVVGVKPDDPQLHAFPLWDDEVVLIVPTYHEWATRSFVPLDDLRSQPFVFREKGSGTRQTFEQFLAQYGFSPRRLTVVAEVGSTEAVKQFVAAGNAVGVVSIRAVDCETEAKRLAVVRLREGRITRQFFAAVPTDRSLSPAGETFLQFLRSQTRLGVL